MQPQPQRKYFLLDRVSGGWQLSVFDELDSTNNEALRRLENGEETGGIILAKSQTNGKGRNGKSWVSGQGNLLMSATVTIPNDRCPSDLAFVAAVAAGEAIDTILPLSKNVQIKWPNDLLIEGKKTGGILVEGLGARHKAVIGIGINLESAPKVRGINATCMESYGVAVTAMEMVNIIGLELREWLTRWENDGLPTIVKQWKKSAMGLGETISIRLANDDVLLGRFDDILDDGRLLLRVAKGEIRYITSGEVFFGSTNVTCD
jgi:BirA family biotin operon repressor/biotin-[acetyl-CoA-carboxylase] ligase